MAPFHGGNTGSIPVGRASDLKYLASSSHPWVQNGSKMAESGTTRFWRFTRKLKELYSWYSFVVGVGALLATGVGLAIGMPVWLVKNGIPLPLAIMAGFCTFVAAIYLAMAPPRVSSPRHDRE